MKKALALILLVCLSYGHAQDSIHVTDGFRSDPNFGARKVVATTAIGGLLGLSIYWSYDSWWRDSSRKFHFFSDGWWNNYSRGIDKLGHFYTSYFYFHLFRNIMLWGGYENSTADGWALASSAAFAVIVELGDGFTPKYGFDYQDLTYNVGGLAYGYLQSKVPILKNFNFKWSYVPRDGYRFPVRLVEHYDDHTYWLAVNVNNLLPASFEPYWPDWLQLAVGMGVDDGWTKREFVFGFDISLEAIFQPESPDWILLHRTLNKFHIPAPAIKFTERKAPRYYLFHKN